MKFWVIKRNLCVCIPVQYLLLKIVLLAIFGMMQNVVAIYLHVLIEC